MRIQSGRNKTWFETAEAVKEKCVHCAKNLTMDVGMSTPACKPGNLGDVAVDDDDANSKPKK